MSNQQVNTKLKRWRGPFFPPSLPKLQDAYAKWFESRRGLNTSVLVKAANGLREYRCPFIEKTEDGYFWARGLVFKVVRKDTLFPGLAAVLFPHCTDAQKSDGTATDRSIALYASTDAVTLGDLDALVLKYCVQFIPMAVSEAHYAPLGDKPGDDMLACS
ncbi:MAG TPA: hypothetical protein VMH91_03225 [Candidatus Paceibacterota bacterium]|nr:hypothetical protein [Candidatus Paceibacterota bacterium]